MAVGKGSGSGGAACPQCGAVCSGEAKFCGRCGAPLEPNESKPKEHLKGETPARRSGRAATAEARSGGSFGRLVAGAVALVVLALVVIWLILPEEDEEQGQAGTSGSLQTVTTRPATATKPSAGATAVGKSGGAGGFAAISLGATSFRLPDPNSVVQAADWGAVPANQLGVVLAGGSGRVEAERVAKELGGAVRGELAYINLFQIETAGKTEADLRKVLSAARALAGVELAFPVQQDFPDETTIEGVPCTPLADPVYGGENGKPYEMIGVQAAWNYIKASGLELSDTRVGVVDTALYRGKDEFEASKFETLEPDDATARPDFDGPNEVPAGTHGTAVASVIGADAGNGGISGVAGVLGKKLTVSVTNRNAPAYAATKGPNGATWSIGTLMAIQKQVELHAKVINLSFGASNADPSFVQAARRFFEKMGKDHPDVLFVASAGNDGKALDGSKRFPSGLNLPNMITVGNVNNDGTRRATSNFSSANFEVSIAAPGDGVPSGVGPDGTVANKGGGTSLAVPQVTAAAALLRALNPKLGAGEIKKIILDTGAAEVTTSGKPVKVDASLGGKVLRVDKAVLRVINDLRKAKNLAAVSGELLEKLATVDALAKTSQPKEYTIVGAIGAVREGGADLKVEMIGQGLIKGNSTKHLNGAGQATWELAILDEAIPPTIRLARLDTGACADIFLPAADQGVATKGGGGAWVLTRVYTSNEKTKYITMTDTSAKTSVKATATDRDGRTIVLQNYEFMHDWVAPPSVIEPGEQFGLKIGVADNGSTHGPGLGLFGDGFTKVTLALRDPRFGGYNGVTGEKVSAGGYLDSESSTRWKKSDSKMVTFTGPKRQDFVAAEADGMEIVFGAGMAGDVGDISAAAIYEYTFQTRGR